MVLSAQGGKWTETKAEVALSPDQLTILPPLPPSMRSQGPGQEVGGIGLENASEMSVSLVSEDGKGEVAAGDQGPGQGQGVALGVDTLEPSVAEDAQVTPLGWCALSTPTKSLNYAFFFVFVMLLSLLSFSLSLLFLF